MFHKVSNKPQPGLGVFPPEWLETTFMPAAVRRRSHDRRCLTHIAEARQFANEERIKAVQIDN